MSSSNCCFLTCIQISQEAGQVVWYSHLLKNFPPFIVIHTVKGFGIVNKAEVDVFLELSCFWMTQRNVGNLISGSSAFSKSSLNIWKFTVHILLKSGLENFEHYLLACWDINQKFQIQSEHVSYTNGKWRQHLFSNAELWAQWSQLFSYFGRSKEKVIDFNTWNHALKSSGCLNTHLNINVAHGRIELKVHPEDTETLELET